MNKKLFLLPILSLMTCGSLVSCGNSSDPTPCTTHVDANHDKKCDVCGAFVPCNHVDADHDGKCDLCKQGGLAIKHVDDNKDYHCDVCQAVIDHDHVDVDENGICDKCGADVPIPVKEPEEFGGYRRVYYPENGKQYLLGIYQRDTSNMIFFNGSPHRDGAGEYPYYLGCNKYTYTGQAEETQVTLEGTEALVEVNYIQDSTELFTIKYVDETGVEDPQYYGGYLQVYGDFNNNVKTSLKFDPDLELTYKGYTKNDDKLLDPSLVPDYPCSNKFKITKTHTYEDISKDVYAITTDFANGCYGPSETARPVALGTWGTYENVETVLSSAINEDFICHFWEKIPE